ncbi:hypothetical protein KJ652_02115 [Patescibacteria group bacterium]|nr:hypothetical protein [Patescibacteria group bacterium]MBU1123360.1 hypothetical protein [Patescibacteria group bacterium]MBU1911066.1 hypothetical protein [Patescibacteria group bacterium]
MVPENSINGEQDPPENEVGEVSESPQPDDSAAIEGIKEDMVATLEGALGSDEPTEEIDQYARDRNIFEDYLERKEYEHAFKSLLFVKKRRSPHFKALAGNVIRTSLLDLESREEDSYPNIGWNGNLRDKYISEGTDKSIRYKFDLINDLELPEEDIEEAALEVVVELANQLLESVKSNFQRSSFYRHGEIGARTYARRMHTILYFLQVKKEKIPQEVHDIVREVGPYFVLEYEDQAYGYLRRECGTKIPEGETTRKAVELLLDSNPVHSDDMVKKLIWAQKHNSVTLDSEYFGKVKEVFKYHAGNSYYKNIVELQEVFGITEERAAELAKEYANECYEEQAERMQEWGEEQFDRAEGIFEAQMRRLGNNWGVSPDDIEGVNSDASQLCEAIESAESAIGVAEASHLWEKAMVEKGVRSMMPHQLRIAIKTELIRGHDDVLKKLRTACNNSRVCTQDIYDEQLVEVFRQSQEGDEPLLHLEKETSRNLLKSLMKNHGSELSEQLKREYEYFLEAHGLNVQSMGIAICACSNTRKQREDNPDKFDEYNSHENVIGRILERISELEEVAPGCAQYFQEKWGVNMFNRYTFRVLFDAYRRETGKSERDKKFKGHVLVLLPGVDWNGNFEDHEMVTNVYLEANRNGYELHWAESGKRVGCFRRLASCKKRYGPLKAAVIGGHSNETLIEFGPRAEDRLTLDELVQLDVGEEQLAPELQNKLDRIKEYFDPNAVITFKSCSIGDEHGIADRIARLIKRVTIGAKSPSSLKDISLDLAEAKFMTRDKRGIPRQVEAKTYHPSKISKWMFGLRKWRKEHGL